MPAIPSVTLNVRDFGTGVASPATMRPVVHGVSSLGTANVVSLYSEQQTLRDEQGEGPAVELAANVLSKGGGPIVFVPSAASVAATNGSVTQSGAGPLITLSGTATIDAFVRLQIMLGGALGTAKFRYCVDGYSGDTDSERTWTETLLVPAGGTFAVPGLGITITFPAGSYVLSEEYTFSVECAAGNASDLAAAFTALAASTVSWRFIAVATSKGNGDETALATLAAALQTQLASLATSNKFRRGMIATDAGESTAAQVVTAAGATVASRCLMAFGMVRRTTTKTFSGYAFPVTHSLDVFAARAAASIPSTDLKRVKSGALEEVIKLFHDEYKTPSSLDDNKISTLRTWEGRPGFYVTQARLKSPAGSDFKLWPLGIVMDIACETLYGALVQWVGSDMRIKTDGSGSLDDRDADAIEEDVAAKLVAQLMAPQTADGNTGYVTDLRVSVDRSNNFLSTGVIQGTVGILPRGYADYVSFTVGYVAELPAEAAA